MKQFSREFKGGNTSKVINVIQETYRKRLLLFFENIDELNKIENLLKKSD